jgi:hypothetical protein
MHIHDAHRFALLVVLRRGDERAIEPHGEKADGDGPDIGKHGIGDAKETGRVREILHGVYLVEPHHFR